MRAEPQEPVEYLVPARGVGDSRFIISFLRPSRYRTLRALDSSHLSSTWGSTRKASLHPRLYAIATLRGAKANPTDDELNQTSLQFVGRRPSETSPATMRQTEVRRTQLSPYSLATSANPRMQNIRPTIFRNDKCSLKMTMPIGTSITVTATLVATAATLILQPAR